MFNVELSPSWYTYYRELCELFKNDNEISIGFDEDNMAIEISTSQYEKSLALKKILPSVKEFGSVKYKINIIYNEPKMDIVKAFKTLSINNSAFKCIYTVPMASNPIHYVMFAKEVVQYWDDDLSNPYGITSTLYESIARDVFENMKGVIFSTDSEMSIEWMERFAQEQIKNSATKEEIEEWEKYNGKGSYSNGSAVKYDENEKITSVKDENTFKSIFSKKK